MTSNNKRSATKKKTTQKKRGRPKKTAAQAPQHSFRDEIIMLIAITGSILLFLSIYITQTGIIGEAVRNFFFGVFGLITYILPFYIFIITAFKLSNKRNRLAKKKIVFSFVLILIICTVIHIITTPYTASLKVTDYLADYYYYSGQVKGSGGVIGGFFGNILYILFGRVGGYVIAVLFLITTLILLTEKSLIKFIQTIMGDISVIKSEQMEARRLRKEAREAELDEEEATLEPQQSKIKYASDDTSNLLERVTMTMLDGDKQSLSEEMIPEVTELSEEVIIQTEEEPVIIQEKQIETVEAPIERPKTKPQQPIESREELKIDLNGNVDKEISYQFPPIELLTQSQVVNTNKSNHHLKENAIKLQTTLQNFGVKVTVTNISCGPSVTRYELQPEQGVKVSRIVSLADDIKLNLAAADIRIEAPIPGKAAVGIEVPNAENQMVLLRDIIGSDTFKKHPSDIAFAVGKDIGGQAVVTDIAKMPHLLIAGATGSGKSVCINTLITSILYKAKPSDVKMIMIDPKVVELSVYNGIPHLLIPVVVDPKKAASALHWAVAEMTDRYKKFAEQNVRDLKGYNQKIIEQGENKLPQIVIIVDELADLMMVAPGEVEDAICRLAQMARAAGIHLVIATQRPSVNVITGLIKANVPSRISFAVSSGIDSRTIIDMHGAEKLLGKGDMLFYPVGMQKPARVQGAFISDKEVSSIVSFLATNQVQEASYNEQIISQINSSTTEKTSPAFEQDEYYEDAVRFVIEKDKASIGMLQRYYRVGFNRAARIMDQLHEGGIVGPEEGSKPRKVLITLEEYEGKQATETQSVEE